MRMSGQVERCPVVITEGRDDECVSVPTPGRVAHPGGIGILWKRSPIGKNLPIDGLIFVQDGNQPGRLDNSQREIADPNAGFRTGWKTIDSVCVVAEILLALFEESRSP